MNVRKKYIKLLLASVVALFGASCSMDEYNEICDYTVQLRYDYNEENTADNNMIDYYVDKIDEYIFDEQGILFLHRQISHGKCREYLHSEVDLPPGQYSVIAIGNVDERSEVIDITSTSTGLKPPIPGVTRREDIRLSLNNCENLFGNTIGPSEKLYYGYKTFTVLPNKISLIRVDVINAHLSLKLRVTWKNGIPATIQGYYMQLEGLPSEYNLMPEFIYPARSFDCENHNTNSHDAYPSNCNVVIHHIPHTCHQNSNVLTHRYDSYITNDHEMWGQFTTYRIKNATPTLLNIYHYDENTQQTTKILSNGIDLQAYFAFRQTNLDQTLKQDYLLSVEIDGDKTNILPLNVGDWEEGGALQ